MNISRSDLYRIIVEEYIKEEGIELSEDKADDLLAWIKGGEKPEYLDYEKEVPTPPEVPEKEDSETFIMDAPVGGDMSDEEIVASISQMIQGRDPEHVSELFQAVFAQIPGVEMGPAEEEPETLYTPGAEGRPQVGFQLEELMELIREVLEEGHDMRSEEEIERAKAARKTLERWHSDALDPHGFDDMSDAELVDAMHTDGMEEMIRLDGEGDLVNRDEVIAALKNV